MWPRMVLGTTDLKKPNNAGSPARWRPRYSGLARQIATAVDWPCQLHTLLRDRNFGCRIAVSSAIDWFFDHEEEGMILEDDCLPSEDFFRFCDELLPRFRLETRVMAVCGSCY